jgi:hypothetical protein
MVLLQLEWIVSTAAYIQDFPGPGGTRPPEADGLADSWRVKRAPPRSGSVTQTRSAIDGGSV